MIKYLKQQFSLVISVFLSPRKVKSTITITAINEGCLYFKIYSKIVKRIPITNAESFKTMNDDLTFQEHAGKDRRWNDIPCTATMYALCQKVWPISNDRNTVKPNLMMHLNHVKKNLDACFSTSSRSSHKKPSTISNKKISTQIHKGLNIGILTDNETPFAWIVIRT